MDSTWLYSTSRLRLAILPMAIFCVGLGLALPMEADDPELASVNVLVKEAETDEPVAFARLTLQYRDDRGKLKRAKTISLAAKTNLQGRYKFVNIPKGTIRLMVIADRRQTFGQEIELEEDGQLIEVRLRKPQPLL